MSAPESKQLSLFMVEIRKASYDTQYLFRTETADQAVEIYLQKVIDGNFTAEPEDLAEDGELRVIRYPNDGPAGFVDWSDADISLVQAEDYAVWTNAIAGGFDPFTGAWDDAGPSA